MNVAVIDAFDAAQRGALLLLARVVARLEAGQTEADVARIATELAPELGFDRWFHKPHVRFDPPARPACWSRSRRKLAPGTLVEIDVGPANPEAFGDAGTTVFFGPGTPPPLLAHARELCRAACGYANRWKCTGEVFVFADAWVRNRGASLGGARSIGHRCFPPSGWAASGWPTLARAAIVMRRNQIQWFNPRRMNGIFAVQPRLAEGERSCTFEEMIVIDGETRRVLGRGAESEIGTLPAV